MPKLIAYRPFAPELVAHSHTLGTDNWIRLDQAEATIVACATCNMTMHGIRAMVTVGEQPQRILCKGCVAEETNHA